MRRIRDGGAVMAVGLLLALSACAPAPQLAAPPVSMLVAAATPAKAVWSLPVDVVGEPVVAGGVVATYVRTAHGGLEVRAFGLADGAELWRRKAVVGHEAQGIEVDLELVRSDGRDLVTFLSPSPNWHPYELVVVGIATGEPVRVVHAAVVAERRPSACGEDVCFTGWALDTQRLREPARELKADLKTGRIAFDDRVALPKGAFSIGPDVFAAPDGDGQLLGHTAHGKVAWTVPYTRLFGTGADTSGGWAWDRAGGLLIGTGSKADTVVDGVGRLDFADERTVALDPATGRVRWALPHVGRCINDETLRATGGVIELCRLTGTATTAKDDLRLRYRDVRVERLGIDVTSGAVRWRHRGVTTDEPWKTVAGLGTSRWQPFQVGNRWVLLDRVTGATTAPPAAAVLACAGDRSELTAPNPDDDGRPGSYSAGTFLRACGGGELSRFAVTSGGVDGGFGWWAVAGEHRLSAYHFDA